MCESLISFFIKIKRIKNTNTFLLKIQQEQQLFVCLPELIVFLIHLVKFLG